MEIFAGLKKHKEQIFLILDLKNSTGQVHKILDIKLENNIAGLEINQKHL